MAVCHWCLQEMKDTVSCTVTDFHIDGEPIRRKPYRGRSPAKRCGDCGTPFGGYHHPGCDQEKCPRCPPRRQGITCGCTYDEDLPDPEATFASGAHTLDGQRAVWIVDGRSVLLDEHGISPVPDL